MPRAGSFFYNQTFIFQKMSHKYGPIMGVKLLHSYAVILSDMEVMHQAFVKQGPIFSGRQKGGIFDVFSGGRGKKQQN